MPQLPKLSSDTILAPMAGVTDVAFRVLCRRSGAGLTCTEMISANALARSNQATLKLINLAEEEKPRVIQLFGQNTDCLIKSAQFIEQNNLCEIIDLNFGCPAEKIIRQGAGSALLERPNKIKEIIEAVTKAVKIPVTCKLRLGIRTSNINILKVAKICEEAGASMLTIHARTQNQGYTGTADWSWIKKVKEAAKIPVCGNGDVRTVEDYVRMKKETGCDYVMIGRGAIGNPYLFKQISDYNKTGKYSERTKSQQMEDFFAYLKLAKRYKVDFQYIRFQAMAFTKGLPDSAQLRLKLSKVKNIKEIERVIVQKDL
ncbi:MAG TPA: tRNA dihydrouridine synthase DusB [Candidatus Nanoarchaeia archaeon]|nr:tRNA dihydrouridine synthase DusB [Candidatus Nanoarchaeia archaeon]